MKLAKGDEISGTTPVCDIVGIRNWNDKKQRWDGVVCQVMKDHKGREFVEVYDVLSADTKVEIDDLIAQSIRTKPWLSEQR